jgi:hypothetical protein
MPWIDRQNDRCIVGRWQQLPLEVFVDLARKVGFAEICRPGLLQQEHGNQDRQRRNLKPS